LIQVVRPGLQHLAPLLHELGPVVGAAQAVAHGVCQLRLDHVGARHPGDYPEVKIGVDRQTGCAAAARVARYPTKLYRFTNSGHTSSAQICSSVTRTLGSPRGPVAWRHAVVERLDNDEPNSLIGDTSPKSMRWP